MSHGHADSGSILSTRAAQVVAETMQALAAPSRVRILSRLAHGACSVGDLAAAIEMEQSAVSQQLRVLRQLGLVVGRRAGRQVIYGLHDDHVRTMLAEAVSHAEHLRLGLTAVPASDGVGASLGASAPVALAVP